AHLYDINPVGVLSMALASTLGILAYLGWFGTAASQLSHFLSLGICFVCVPFIAWVTRGRYYLARRSTLPLIDVEAGGATCCICETRFDTEDMSYCPAYQGAICSLCCTLDSRCIDSCKPEGRFSEQLKTLLRPVLPQQLLPLLHSRLAQFLGILVVANLMIAVLLSLIHYKMQPVTPDQEQVLQSTLVAVFFMFLIVSGVIAWLFLLTHESRMVAQQESSRQTQRLMQEIEAHKETDLQLQKAKELAERANSAKTRYLTGISHELRTPLQAMVGYAQLLCRRPDMPPQHHNALQIIRRSGEYLADLIEGLLDISKIEAGRLEIYRNRISFPELIAQMEMLFREQALAKGISFRCHVHNTLPRTVIADEKRLRQILINLLSNAIKYTERGSVDFHVRYRNQVAEFTVVDT